MDASLALFLMTKLMIFWMGWVGLIFPMKMIQKYLTN